MMLLLPGLSLCPLGRTLLKMFEGGQLDKSLLFWKSFHSLRVTVTLNHAYTKTYNKIIELNEYGFG